MIDLNFAMNAFNDYRNKYPDSERINLKVAHMKRVMKNNINLAKNLKLSDEDINLAGLIGLLHDFGRFEQVRIYDTFIDSKSINHAMFSSEQLFKNGLIRNFIIDDSYDSIIKAAIENHNKFEIEPGLSEEALLHSKMIRDSDKIDIYVEVTNSDANLVFDGPYNIDDTISEKVFRDYMDHKCIKTEDMHCKADDYVRKVALIYGLYFPQSLQAVQDQKLIDKLTEHFKKNFIFSNMGVYKTIDIVNNVANKYINRNIELAKESTNLERE